MARYCEVQDVQRFIKWVKFGEESKPINNQDVEYFIDESDAEIDGRIGSVYEVPIQDENDRKIVGYISARLTAYTVAKILVGQAGGEIPDTIQEAKKEADKRIEDILARKVILENTPIRARRHSALYSYTAHNPEAPDIKWQLDKEQW